MSFSLKILTLATIIDKSSWTINKPYSPFGLMIWLLSKSWVTKNDYHKVGLQRFFSLLMFKELKQSIVSL